MIWVRGREGWERGWMSESIWVEEGEWMGCGEVRADFVWGCV